MLQHYVFSPFELKSSPTLTMDDAWKYCLQRIWWVDVHLDLQNMKQSVTIHAVMISLIYLYMCSWHKHKPRQDLLAL